jgi:membrane-associated phospholipid phosphatase
MGLKMKKNRFPTLFTLPLFINQENKYFAGIFLSIIAAFLYLTSNHIHIITPQQLPMGWIDNIVPFLPYTIWIYLSEYVLFIVIYVGCRDLTTLNKYFYSFLFLQSLSVAVFWIWPTTYPRELFPLPTDLDPVSYFIFNSVRQTDSAANCCPSLHISCVYLSVFIFLEEQRKKFPFFFIWGTCIAVSTLTTKQHYWIDVIAGLIMAIFAYRIFHSFIAYKPVSFKISCGSST